MSYLDPPDTEDEVAKGSTEKWQDKISSGFDRLMSFASTELDKRRRSTEGDSAASCNTSPDSGIGHGDPPPPPPLLLPSTTSGRKRSASTSSAPASDEPESEPTPMSLPKMPRLLNKSPPPPDGPPRTPSPSSSADEQTPSSNEPFTSLPSSSTSSVPLKYQRPEYHHHHHHHHNNHHRDYNPANDNKQNHFKKKFVRESWSSNWTQAHPNQQKGKFRPKGKEWDWNGSKPDFSVPPPNMVDTTLPPPFHPHHPNRYRHRWDRFNQPSKSNS